MEFEDKEEDKFLNALNRQNNLLTGNDISVRFLGEAIKDMRDHQIWQIYWLGKDEEKLQKRKTGNLSDLLEFDIPASVDRES